MENKEICVEIQIDESTFWALLDDVADYVNGLPNEELMSFIRDSFHVVAEPAPRADGILLAAWKPNRHYADLLPALLAGEMDFDAFKNVLHTKVGVGNDPGHA